MLTARPATTLDDLRQAQAMCTAAWVAGDPLAVATAGALAWFHASSAPDRLEEHLRLWSDGDRVVAWTWHDSGEIEWGAWTGDPRRDRGVVAALTAAIVAEEGDDTVAMWTAEDDVETVETLETAGFVAAGRRLSQWQRRLTPDGKALPEVPTLPDGYRIRSLRGREDLPARVEVHRAAFTPSRLTVEKYERLVDLPPYRFEDDLVVEAPDGSFAAFAMAWWDVQGRVGEFEPVGTHPAHQRRGIGLALLRHGLHRFAGLGASVVQVYSDASNAASEGLYAAVGFERRAFHQRFERAPR
jgi:ribosomal protein S18 acetylase RimI-like enzyme